MAEQHAPPASSCPSTPAAASGLSRRTLFSAGTAALGALALPSAAQAKAGTARICIFDGLQPVALIISGPGVQANRGAVDVTRDRMLTVHGHRFDAAWACGLDAINSLEAEHISTTVEYDGKTHELRGPLLQTVLQAAGVDLGQAMAAGHWLLLQGIDGYRAQLPLTDAIRWKLLLATHMDGQPLAMGGLGPLWAMYASEDIAELADKPLDQRFTQAVWGLYYMAIAAQPPQP
ncbi:molybdopterin-dependent oxidoreductase [Comamonas sp.]|uniref:molybdopterin-dependent oxidoreductase n=1 Tax=Comamonas sp. TaxID=34028 RepID=UPI003A8EF956